MRIEHANVGAWVGRDFDNIQALWGPADGLEFTGMRELLVPLVKLMPSA